MKRIAATAAVAVIAAAASTAATDLTAEMRGGDREALIAATAAARSCSSSRDEMNVC